MDSIKNFVDSAQADEGDYVIGYILCGLVEVCVPPFEQSPAHYTYGGLTCLQSCTQLGGVVYVLIVLIVLTLAIPLAQLVNFFVGLLYDTIVLLVAASKIVGEGGDDDAPKPAAAPEKKKKKDTDKKKPEKRTLSSVFSRSRNNTKNTDKEAAKAIKKGQKPVEWPNKDPLKFATQKDVNLAIEDIKKLLLAISKGNDKITDRELAQLSVAVRRLDKVDVPALRAFTIRSLADLQFDFERVQKVVVPSLRAFLFEKIVELQLTTERLQGQRAGAQSASSSATVFSRSSGGGTSTGVQAGFFSSGVERLRRVFVPNADEHRYSNKPYDEVSTSTSDDEGGEDSNEPYHTQSGSDQNQPLSHTGAYTPSKSEQDAMDKLGGVILPV